MAAYLVRIGATVSNDAFVSAAASGCVSAIDAMLRQDTSASLDIGKALQNVTSGHPMALKRLQEEWRNRHGNQEYPLVSSTTMDEASSHKGGDFTMMHVDETVCPEVERPSLLIDPTPLSLAFEVFTNRGLVRSISHFRPLSAKLWYERVMKELPSSIRDFVDGAQIPGLLPRLAIMRGETDVLVPLHSMSQNPAYRDRRDLDFSSAMYDAAIEGRVDVLKLLHEMPGMTCRCDTMAVAIRSGWTDVVDWLAKHRPESAGSLTTVDIDFAVQCGFEEVVLLATEVQKLKLIKDSTGVKWTVKTSADAAAATSSKSSWWETLTRGWK
ncbi:hypothetical protein PINS_up015489 [Pythium insidiosum]|nr:hypothetical protein PINS_up015489 [Pythium insidiosum]